MLEVLDDMLEVLDNMLEVLVTCWRCSMTCWSCSIHRETRHDDMLEVLDRTGSPRRMKVEPNMNFCSIHNKNYPYCE